MAKKEYRLAKKEYKTRYDGEKKVNLMKLWKELKFVHTD